MWRAVARAAAASALVALGPALACGARAHAKVAGPELIPADAARILQEVRRPGASAVLVNVWATWCTPCREEFPDVMKLHRDLEAKGLRLVLVAADFDDDRAKQVREFLRYHEVEFASFLKEQPDEAFIDGLSPRWSGALPGSLLFDGAGELREVWEGAKTYAWMRNKVDNVIGSTTRGNKEIE